MTSGVLESGHAKWFTSRPVWWLALAYLATRVPFVYGDGFPDGDVQHIALGILDGTLSRDYFHSTRAYGVTFSFGYYAAHFVLAPLYRAHPFLIFSVINWSGLVAGLVGLLALYRFTAGCWGGRVALAAAWLWAFAPGWWELTTFGHPTTIAMSLFLCALAFSAAAYGHASWRRTAALLWSGLFYFAALAVRADFLLGAPLLLALPLSSPRARWGDFRAALGVVLGGLLLFAVAHHAVFSEGGSGGVAAFATKALSVLRPAGGVVIKETVVWLLGVGVITFVLGFVALSRLISQAEQRRAAIVVLAGILPGAAWWLQGDGAFRHFLLPSMPLVLALALGLASLRFALIGRRAIALIAGMILANQVAALLLCPAIVARYPWTYRTVSGERRWTVKVPLGDWFSNHTVARHLVDRESDEARWLVFDAADSTVEITPSAYRSEFEFLARYPRSYRYVQLKSPEAGVECGTLSSPTRTLFFVAGDPGPVARAIQASRDAGSFRARAVFVPASGVPARLAFPIPGRELDGTPR